MRQQERRRRPLRAPAILLAAGAIALAGCGSGDSGSGASSAATQPTKSPTTFGGAAEKEAPEGASPVLKQLYRQFPKPSPDPKVKGSGKALEAGESACKKMSPSQVKERFYAQATENLLPDQKQMIKQIAHYASRPETDVSFVAGQLAALVYEKSLPSQRTARYGFQGCIYQLARGAEHRLEAKAK